MDKKVTRKEFILSIISILTIFVAIKAPSFIRQNNYPKNNNTYGNHAYGGTKRNV